MRRGIRRWPLLLVGSVALGLGTVGIFLPVLPTTGFYILAAWCFARSSPRMEQRILDLPRFGPMIRDYRAGLGMPRRAKVLAIAMIALACGVSAAFALSTLGGRIAVAVLGLIGILYVGLRVPTRERVLAQRAAAGDPPAALAP